MSVYMGIVGANHRKVRMDELIQAVFDLSPDIRYVAVVYQGKLVLRERAGLSGASASESDRFEELLVNPTVLTALTQRGNIDCGGLRFVVIRYGNFFQVVRPLLGGHLSVAVEPQGDPLAIARALEAVLVRRPPPSAG